MEDPEPVFSSYRRHTRELEQLFNRQETIMNQQQENIVGNESDDSEDDCICESDKVPLPLPSTNWSTSKGLIKRENDLISANIPFITTVCTN